MTLTTGQLDHAQKLYTELSVIIAQQVDVITNLEKLLMTYQEFLVQAMKEAANE